MRLSKIKLAGFKSFVDPTTVNLVSNLVGVVGPNGSGKSNIIDAVRWVMGESSAKQLRGGSMSDVIFSGSSARKPVGQASVELVFDNTVGKKLGGEFARYDEISIKRQVTRDGQSVYFLNGSKCRRRDITDIFLGTGLGPRSYAIIEQGMISKLIEAKPEDLRTTIEEAAGISKYKERRRETENRMKNTHENLNRINDIREELDKQLEKLQRQARTAERYKTLKQEERKLKGELLALQWREIDNESRTKDLAVSKYETELEAVIATQRGFETGIEQHREAHIEVTDVFNEIQANFYQIGSDIATKEQNIQHVKSRRSELMQDRDQIETDMQEANIHQHTDQSRLQELTEKIADIEPSLEEVNERAEISEELLLEAEEQQNNWQSEWDNFTHSSSEPAKIAEVERTRVGHMEDQSRQLASRHKRLLDEFASLDSETLEAEIEEISLQFEDVQAIVETLKDNQQYCQSTISDIRHQNSETSTQLAAQRLNMHKLSGRISSLEALQEAALGKGDSQLSTWLKTRFLSDAPRLAQGINVKDGWEKAIETVLGFHLEAVCVDDISGLDIDGLDENIEFFTKTSVGSVSAEKVLAEHDLPLLSEQIDTQWPVAVLMCGVYCVDNIAQANAVRGSLVSGESVVTPDGVWFGQNWLRVNKGKDEHSGVLQREKDLAELQIEIAQTTESVETLETAQEEGKETLHELELQRDEIQTQLNSEERRRNEVKSQNSAKQMRIDQINSRREQIQREMTELKSQLEINQALSQEARGRLEVALDAMDEVAQKRELLLSRRDEVRNLVNETRITATEDGRQAHALQLEFQSSQSSLIATQQNLSRVEQQLKSLRDRKEQLSQMLNADDNPLEDLNRDLEILLEQRVEVEAQLSEVRHKVESIDAEMRTLINKRGDAEQAVQNARSLLEQSRMDGQTLKVRRQTILEQLVNAGYELNFILESLSDSCQLKDWERNIEQLAQKIQRLGAINLAAIDEYKEQSERKVYLDSQLADLNEALEILESAIRKIDKETRARFKETFDLVNVGMKKLFPKLFGGGHAYLELTGEDLLDTGVTILARPPGKRVTNIHLLSGGEKALTAVAMVFSIFQLNPAPFCMLDEVDAPLDEANVGRFSNLVSEMSEHLQFIFISHNKTTMEIAGNLNGVTMHEPGVSRMVSVDVEEAAELAAM